MQRHDKHASTTRELLFHTVFATRTVPKSYLEDNWGDAVHCQLRVKFCAGGCEGSTWAREAEESPLLETVDRERLMKAQQAGKRLSGCCGDL
jgi:hypothetical protein